MNTEKLSPGIRDLVIYLNSIGFQTTDSGDGTNFVEGMKCATPEPMVAMVVHPDALVAETIRLKNSLEYRGLDFTRPDIVIQGTYSPVDNTALILLFNVLSKDLNIPPEFLAR